VLKSLRRKHAGYGNYYGIVGNSASLSQFAHASNRILFKWLNRRSQKRSYNWPAFNRMLKRFGIHGPAMRPKSEPPCQQRELKLCDFIFRLAGAWRV